jgi:serpin B
MKHFLARLLLLTLVVVAAPTLCAATRADSAQNLQNLVSGNTKFALDLYRQLKGSGENIFFSPYSISEALGMTYVGARAETESQMAKALCFSLNQTHLHRAFADLRHQLEMRKQRDSIQLDIANMLWPQVGYELKRDFLKTCSLTYDVEIRQLDFVSNTEDSRLSINAWVADKTRNKIRDLITPGVLSPDTRLVLTNAVYFKAAWKVAFDLQQTHIAPFILADSKASSSKFMNQQGRFLYMQTPTAQILQIPYKNDGFSMLVMLPIAVAGLSKLEESLTADSICIWRSRLQTNTVNVFLPKFKLTSAFNLGATLKSLGMVNAFRPTADFSGMSDHDTLFVSEVIHKAFVDVSEEGTEAAAATAVVVDVFVDAVHIDLPVIQFRADHPFLFLICDNSTGAVLFLGRLTDPSRLN